MNVWLDDIRPAPPGWVHVRSYEEAIELIEHQGERISEISLDHDLCEHHVAGDFSDNRTGFDVLHFLLACGYRPIIDIHTMNPAGMQRMQGLLEHFDIEG
jgi:hypothetical protein